MDSNPCVVSRQPLNCNPECHVTHFFLSSFSLAGIYIFFINTASALSVISVPRNAIVQKYIKCLRVGFFLEVYQVTPRKTLTLHYVAHND